MTKIEWTDRTWNPVTGCNKVSQGCKNCYAEVMHKRQMAMNPHKYSKPFNAGVEMHMDLLDAPKKWKKPSRVFVNSMSDLFHEGVSFQFILNALLVMEACPQHTFQVLTKRPWNAIQFSDWMRANHRKDFKFPSNVWLGVSCEDQKSANDRIPPLQHIPAHVRFLSLEPLLGPINLTDITFTIETAENGGDDVFDTYNCLENDDLFGWDLPKINWVIVGGESGHYARPIHIDWVRTLRDDCVAHKIPFFFKQWGEWYPLVKNQYWTLPETNKKNLAEGRPYDFIPLNYFHVPLFGDGHRYEHYSLTPEGGKRASGSRPMDFPNDVVCTRVGKLKAGHLLDGKEYREFPKTANDISDDDNSYDDDNMQPDYYSCIGCGATFDVNPGTNCPRCTGASIMEEYF